MKKGKDFKVLQENLRRLMNPQVHQFSSINEVEEEDELDENSDLTEEEINEEGEGQLEEDSLNELNIDHISAEILADLNKALLEFMYEAKELGADEEEIMNAIMLYVEDAYQDA